MADAIAVHGLRGSDPKRINRQGVDAIAERHRGSAGVEDDAAYKPVTRKPGQCAQPPRRVWAQAGASLDLDADNMASGAFQHQVHLDARVGAEVVQAGLLQQLVQ